MDQVCVQVTDMTKVLRRSCAKVWHTRISNTFEGLQDLQILLLDRLPLCVPHHYLALQEHVGHIRLCCLVQRVRSSPGDLALPALRHVVRTSAPYLSFSRSCSISAWVSAITRRIQVAGTPWKFGCWHTSIWISADLSCAWKAPAAAQRWEHDLQSPSCNDHYSTCFNNQNAHPYKYTLFWSGTGLWFSLRATLPPLGRPRRRRSSSSASWASAARSRRAGAVPTKNEPMSARTAGSRRAAGA